MSRPFQELRDKMSPAAQERVRERVQQTVRTYRGRVIKRCAYWWERRTPGARYVNARGQCKRMTGHDSGYCSEHRRP